MMEGDDVSQEDIWDVLVRRLKTELQHKTLFDLGGIYPIETHAHCIYVVELNNLPPAITNALAKAKRNTPAWKLPVVIIHLARQQHSQDVVLMSLQDFNDFLISDEDADALRRA